MLAFTETMVRLGDSTDIAADEAATAIAQLYNIMVSPTCEPAAASLVAMFIIFDSLVAELLPKSISSCKQDRY